ncbi:MAG: glycosyltransferase [Bacteroidota bacterium]|jgi:glycosyltransferase involved in cell wall biosynthesis
MPKVLRIINRFNIGGPTYNVGYLTKYLSPDFETLLIGGDKEEDEESSNFILDELGISPIIIPELKREINLKSDLTAYRKIKKIISEFNPDIVHTHASKAGAIGRLAASKMKVPVIIHTFHGHVFHSYFGKVKTSFYVNIERYLAKKTDAIIAISNKQKSELAHTFNIAPEEKIKVIPLGFDLGRFNVDTDEKRDSFRKKYLIEDNEIVITIIGRLAPVKNHVFFVDVIEEVLKTVRSNVRFFIVGDGETKNIIEEYLKSKSIDFTDFNSSKRKSTVTFTSWIKNVDYPLCGSDIICLTSLNEGTPVSLIEAMAAGKPVVSTNVGGVSDIVPPDLGLISPVGDLRKMAENIVYYIKNTENKINSGTKSRIWANENFHYTRLTNDIKDLYFSILKRSRRKG